MKISNLINEGDIESILLGLRMLNKIDFLEWLRKNYSYTQTFNTSDYYVLFNNLDSVKIGASGTWIYFKYRGIYIPDLKKWILLYEQSQNVI